MSEELTQELVDEMFITVQKEWDEKLKESGESSVAMFVAMDNSGWVSEFLTNYQDMKDYLPTVGLIPPVLKGAEDIKITFN